MNQARIEEETRVIFIPQFKADSIFIFLFFTKQQLQQLQQPKYKNNVLLSLQYDTSKSTTAKYIFSFKTRK